MQSEYFLLVEDTIIVDCCEKRYQMLLSEGYAVKVMVHSINLRRPLRHCPLGCVKA